MDCPKCGNVLLFPDLDDLTARDRSRRRLCALCGWTMELDARGRPYTAPEWAPAPDDAENAQARGGRPLRPSSLANTTTLDKRMIGHTRYDGCKLVAPSCLECPLPRGCRCDYPEDFKAWQLAQRSRDWFQGRPVAEISKADVPAEVARTGLDPRTVYRRLALLRLMGGPEVK